MREKVLCEFTFLIQTRFLTSGPFCLSLTIYLSNIFSELFLSYMKYKIFKNHSFYIRFHNSIQSQVMFKIQKIPLIVTKFDMFSNLLISVTINEVDFNVLHIFQFCFTMICHLKRQIMLTGGPYKRNK